MRLPLRLPELLVVTVAADAVLLGAGVAPSVHVWPLLPVLAAPALVVAYLRLGAERLRLLALLGLVVVLFALPQAVLILARPPHAPIQDGLLLTEAAAGRLLAGQDPYGHDYLDSAALRAFYVPEFPVNPLLGHYVYPPGPILLAAPFHALGLDLAWLWVPAILLLALGAYAAAGRAGVIAVALSPVLLLDYLSLFNDLLFLAAALAAIGLLRRRWFFGGGLLLGLALVLKQQAVIFLPFAALLAWPRWPRALAGVVAAAGVVCLPFLLWSPGAFLGDTAAYFYGSGLASFPIRGFGLAGLLLAAGLIPNRWAAYPAGAVQALVVLPELFFALRGLARRLSWPAFWAWQAAVAAALFLLGRTLAPNYVTLIVLLLTLALASGLEDPAPAPAVARRLDQPAGQPGV